MFTYDRLLKATDCSWCGREVVPRTKLGRTASGDYVCEDCIDGHFDLLDEDSMVPSVRPGTLPPPPPGGE